MTFNERRKKMDEELQRRGENLAGVIKAIVRDVLYDYQFVTADVAKTMIEEGINKAVKESSYTRPHNWPTDNAGQGWTSKEDISLGEEWAQLIQAIARRHHRTFGSIRSRIGQKIYDR